MFQIGGRDPGGRPSGLPDLRARPVHWVIDGDHDLAHNGDGAVVLLTQHLQTTAQQLRAIAPDGDGSCRAVDAAIG